LETYTDVATGIPATHFYRRIYILAAAAQAMEQAIKNRQRNPGMYGLYFRNGADFVENVLHAGNVGGVLPHNEIFSHSNIVGNIECEALSVLISRNNFHDTISARSCKIRVFTLFSERFMKWMSRRDRMGMMRRTLGAVCTIGLGPNRFGMV
jgi:hypothetical protein